MKFGSYFVTLYSKKTALHQSLRDIKLYLQNVNTS